MADLTSSLSSSARHLSDGSRYIILEFTQTRKIETNESEIAWTLKGAGTVPGWVMAGPFEVIIDSVKVHSSSARIKLYKGTVVGSGKITVKHNDDGSKQLPISISAAIYEYAVNCKGSQTFTLVSNPRESTITAADTEIGKLCNITINKSVASYTSTLSYKLYKDDKNNTVLGSGPIEQPKTSKNIVEWEVPTDFYGLLVDTTRGYCVITCDTYNGNNKVGNTKSIAIWITMSGSIAPEITDCIAINTDESTISLVGENAFILGRGSISVSCSAFAKNSATISSMVVINNATTYTIENGETLQILNPIDPDFIFRVTDSRGLFDEEVISLTCYDYTAPSIAIEQVKMELNPSDATKAQITLSIRGNGYDGAIASTQNDITIEFEVSDKYSGEKIIVPNTNTPIWSLEIDEVCRFYEVQNIIIPVDDPDATYSIVATIKDIVTPDGVASKPSVTNRLPVYDYNKENFNFNVPIYYKEVPFVDVRHDGGSLYIRNLYVEYNWRYRIIQDEWIEMWGKVYISSLMFGWKAGSMWTSSIIQVPTPINLEVDDLSTPCVINAQLTSESVIPANGDTNVMMVSYANVGHEIDPNTFSRSQGQYAMIQGISPVQHDDIGCYLYLYISGHKELPKPDYDEGYDEI